jgi:hypothetical protein
MGFQYRAGNPHVNSFVLGPAVINTHTPSCRPTRSPVTRPPAAAHSSRWVARTALAVTRSPPLPLPGCLVRAPELGRPLRLDRPRPRRCPPSFICLSDSQQLNCPRQEGLRASWDLKGEIRVFSPDRNLSREILYLSTNFLSAHSPIEDGIRGVSFCTAFRSRINHALSERARVKPANEPARKDSSIRKNRCLKREFLRGT